MGTHYPKTEEPSFQENVGQEKSIASSIHCNNAYLLLLRIEGVNDVVKNKVQSVMTDNSAMFAKMDGFLSSIAPVTITSS